MSKIKNGGLNQYGAEPFEQQQFGTAGVEGVNTHLPKNKTSRDLDHAHSGAVCHYWTTQSRWKDPRTARSVNRGPHICIWGASSSLAPALFCRILAVVPVHFYPNVTMLRSGLCYRKSVCRLSVCDVGAPYLGVELFGNISSRPASILLTASLGE